MVAPAAAELLSTSSEFMEIIEQAREEFKQGKTLTLEEIKREALTEGDDDENGRGGG